MARIANLLTRVAQPQRPELVHQLDSQSLSQPHVVSDPRARICRIARVGLSFGGSDGQWVVGESDFTKTGLPCPAHLLTGFLEPGQEAYSGR